MPSKRTLLHYTRYTHLYLGVFISPALLFFAFTGALQTFSLHETTRGSSYKPPAWIATLAQIHKKQNMTVPAKKLQPVPAQAAKPAADKPQPPAILPKPHNALPLKVFFLLVSVGLFTSTVSGIYMSYRYARNKPLITSLLIAGTIIPIGLAFLLVGTGSPGKTAKGPASRWGLSLECSLKVSSVNVIYMRLLRSGKRYRATVTR